MKRTFSLFMTALLFTLIFTSCNPIFNDISETSEVDEQVYNEVTDLQLALLNHISYKDDLKNLEGKSIEGLDKLIDDKYKNNISGGDKLVNELKGYKLIDYDYGDITGFNAAAYTKGQNIILVYVGTSDFKDKVEDVISGLFDVSVQDGQAKRFAIDNVKKFPNYNLFITGYSMGGRLCYLGTENVIDNKLGNNLNKVRTFNGLGVKEFWDFADSNLSNIHNLETKFGNKTYDYIVKGDTVSDGDSPKNLKYVAGYNHVGTEFKVPCTNKTDTGMMKCHDLYSIIDYLVNNPPPAENSSQTKNLNGKPVLILSESNYNLGGSFTYVDGDIDVKTWNTFVSNYPQTADPLNQGREYFNKMHITLFFLRDNEGNLIENKGVMNATGFGNDPLGWKDKYGEFDWMYTTPNSKDVREEKNFYIFYKDNYYSGPANCHTINAKLREYVTLGTYEQDGNEDNGKEPIEWLVLTQEDDKMLVVSKNCLDYLRYPDDWESNICWETSSLRDYLNGDFINNTFSKEDQQSILQTKNQNKASDDYYSTVDGNTTEDKVFLLSIDEVQKYLPASTSSESSKIAYGTDYLYNKLKNHPTVNEYGKPVEWALRADVDTSRNKDIGRPREVVAKDSIFINITTGAMRDPDGPLSVVRPAMWIKNTVEKHR